MSSLAPQWSTNYIPDYSHLHGVELNPQQLRDVYQEVAAKGLLSREIATLFQNPQVVIFVGIKCCRIYCANQ